MRSSSSPARWAGRSPPPGSTAPSGTAAAATATSPSRDTARAIPPTEPQSRLERRRAPQRLVEAVEASADQALLTTDQDLARFAVEHHGDPGLDLAASPGGWIRRWAGAAAEGSVRFDFREDLLARGAGGILLTENGEVQALSFVVGKLDQRQRGPQDRRHLGCRHPFVVFGDDVVMAPAGDAGEQPHLAPGFLRQPVAAAAAGALPLAQQAAGLEEAGPAVDLVVAEPVVALCQLGRRARFAAQLLDHSRLPEIGQEAQRGPGVGVDPAVGKPGQGSIGEAVDKLV